MSTTQTDFTPKGHPLPNHIPNFDGVMMIAGDKTTGRRMILVCPNVKELRAAWEEISEQPLDETRIAEAVVVSGRAVDGAQAQVARLIEENSALRAAFDAPMDFRALIRRAEELVRENLGKGMTPEVARAEFDSYIEANFRAWAGLRRREITRMDESKLGSALCTAFHASHPMMTEYIELLFTLRDLQKENEEFKKTFDLQKKRMTKAVELWRAEYPEDRELRSPDLGDLIVWLMNRAGQEKEG